MFSERTGICKDYWSLQLHLVVHLTFLYRKYKTFVVISSYKSTSSNKHLKTILLTRNQLNKIKKKNIYFSIEARDLYPLLFWSYYVKLVIFIIPKLKKILPVLLFFTWNTLKTLKIIIFEMMEIVSPK